MTAAARTVARLVAFAATLALVPSAPTRATEAREDAGAVQVQVRYEDDADGLGGLLARGGMLHDYASPRDYAGWAVQATHYAQDRWREDVVGVMGLYRNQRGPALEGVQAEAGLVSVDGKVRPVGDVTWRLQPRESTGVELIVAGDLVGTRAALERAISYGLAAAGLEQRLGDRWTAIALAGWQPFTDGNARTLLRGRVIYALAPQQGLSAQVRWRQFASRDDDVDGAYFNPGRYRTWDAGLAWRRRVRGWTLAGHAGAGRERIDERPSQATGVAEFRAEGPVGQGSVVAFGLLYSRAAGFNTAPDYWYGALNVSVKFPLR